MFSMPPLMTLFLPKSIASVGFLLWKRLEEFGCLSHSLPGE